MKHDPSTYFGIGKDGFRAIEPRRDYGFDSSGLSGPSKLLPVSTGSYFSRWVPGILVFGFVCTFLTYLFFLA